MKMAALVILIPPMVVLLGAAVAVATDGTTMAAARPAHSRSRTQFTPYANRSNEVISAAETAWPRFFGDSAGVAAPLLPTFFIFEDTTRIGRKAPEFFGMVGSVMWRSPL